MNSQRMVTVLVVVNVVFLAFQLAHGSAPSNAIAPVLRGRALELVDDNGRVRAEIKVLPAQPTLKMPDGSTGFPETVQLRLISSQGSPNVKLAATEDGSGLVLGAGAAEGYVQILARGEKPFIRILNKDGKEEVIKP